MPRSKRFMIGDEAIVRPVHANNPYDLYVRLTEDDDWILSFQELVGAHQPSLFPLKSPPKLGQLVCIEHNQYGWVRGVVIGVCDDCRYSVRTLDYGDVVHRLKAHYIRRLEIGDATASKVIHCRMYMCEPKDGNTWSYSSIETFLDYLGTEPMKMTVMSLTPNGDQLVVELATRWSDTVSKLMVISGSACFGNHSQRVNRLQPVIPKVPITNSVSNGLYMRDTLKIGVETEVRVLRPNGQKINVVRMERYDSYLAMTEMLEMEFTQCEIIENVDVMSVGTPVVSRSTRLALDRFFRGEIVGTKLDTRGMRQAIVYLVDIGEQETVYPTENTLRKCKSPFLEVPTFAISCILNELQKTKKNLLQMFSPGLNLVIRAEQLADNTNTQFISIVENLLSKSESIKCEYPYT